jgi:hypothetical protein
MKKGVCKLCLQEKLLLKKSHIIPDFMYRDGKIYHDDHTIHLIDFGKSLEGKVVSSGIQRSGEYEGNILCRECDGGIIKDYEEYAKKVLFGGNLNKVPIYSRSQNEVLIRNIDYAKFKLFFLSILWRAGISRRPFFKEITIESEKEEELREMILSGNPKDNMDNSMLFMLDSGTDLKLKQYLGQPVSGKDKRSFLFVFPGILVFYFFDLKIVPNNLLNYRIFSTGEIRLMRLSMAQIWDLFKYLFG